MTTEETVALCGQIGKLLLQNGAETSRVEDTVERIGAACGIPMACHATMTAVMVGTPEATQLFKVRVGDFDLRRVDCLNDLSRAFVAGKLDQAALAAAVQRLVVDRQDYTWWQKLLGAGAVAVAPMLLFKATWGDLAWALPVGILGYVATQLAGPRIKTPYLTNALGGVVVGALAAGLACAGWVTTAANVMISALMPLVPGVALTNALRELIARQTISGLVRAADAVMVAGAIGAGVVVGTLLAGIGGGR